MQATPFARALRLQRVPENVLQGVVGYCMIFLRHAVYRGACCRELQGNRIRNISRDTFARLTSLQVLYVPPLFGPSLLNFIFYIKAEAMVTPRRKYRRPAMVTPKSYPYP